MLNVSICSSCGACANVCSHDAISMRLNKEGFYRPTVDVDKCVRCGICEKKCPWINTIENPNGSTANPRTFAAYAKNELIRQESSSGGIFSILAEKVIDEGGAVFGVAQLASTKFGHIIVENKNDLAKLRGSKYVQANVRWVYRDVRMLLKTGRKVLFSGTPCQVAALYSVIGKNRPSNLITVDVVCHGAPSVKVFEKYIAELEMAESARVESTQFRDKQSGWITYSITSLLKNQSGVYKKIESVTKNKFLRTFINGLCLNESCLNCHYAKLPRIADISLGDFWGINHHNPEMFDNKGTSVVLANTDIGYRLFDSIKDNIKYSSSDVRIATSYQKNINGSSKENPKRKFFLKDLDKYSFDALYAKYNPRPTFTKRICSVFAKKVNAVKKILISGRVK